MKRAMRCFALAAALMVPAVFAQHEAEHKAAQHGEAGEGSHGSSGGHSNMDVWKWANFAILAGLIGYALSKNGGKFFAARNEQILKEITEAEQLHKQSEARAAEVDRRLSHLDTEIEMLRAEARRQAAEEGERARAATVAQIAKIRQHAEQEIEAAGKSARQELKRYAAELAVAQARDRIRSGMDPQADDALVKSFAQGLERVRNRPQTS